MQGLSVEVWLSVGSVTIGVIGIVLAVFFYRRSIQKPVPTYGIPPFGVRIVNSSQMRASGLEVLHDGHPIGDRDVMAVTLFFWNEGRTPIRRADVLEPYAIAVRGRIDVLDYRMSKATREVCGFSCGEVLRGEEWTFLKLNFDIIEQSDGAAFQIVYAGDLTAPILLRGVSVGAQEPECNDLIGTLYGVSRLQPITPVAIAVCVASLGALLVIPMSPRARSFVLGVGTGIGAASLGLEVWRRWTVWKFSESAIGRLIKAAATPRATDSVPVSALTLTNRPDTRPK